MPIKSALWCEELQIMDSEYIYIYFRSWEITFQGEKDLCWVFTEWEALRPIGGNDSLGTKSCQEMPGQTKSKGSEMGLDNDPRPRYPLPLSLSVSLFISLSISVSVCLSLFLIVSLCICLRLSLIHTHTHKCNVLRIKKDKPQLF